MILSTKLKQEKEGKSLISPCSFSSRLLFPSGTVFRKTGSLWSAIFSRCATQCHESLSLHIPLMTDDLTFAVGYKQT